MKNFQHKKQGNDTHVLGRLQRAKLLQAHFASWIISCIWTVKMSSILVRLTLCGNISDKMRTTLINFTKSSSKTRKYFSLSIPVPTLRSIALSRNEALSSGTASTWSSRIVRTERNIHRNLLRAIFPRVKTCLNQQQA